MDETVLGGEVDPHKESPTIVIPCRRGDVGIRVTWEGCLHKSARSSGTFVTQTQIDGLTPEALTEPIMWSDIPRKTASAEVLLG